MTSSLKLYPFLLVSPIELDYTFSMIASSNKSAEDMIVEIVATSPYITGPKLIAKIRKHKDFARQTIYMALQNLITNEVVSKVNGGYFLSRVWLHKINSLFYATEKTDALLELNEGEFISYSFPSLLSCDRYWAHALKLLIEQMSPSEAAFLWNPHEWFIIGRQEVETEFLNEFKRKKLYCFLVTRDIGPLDRKFKTDWNSDHIAVHLDNKISLKNSSYITVFGNIIIEVTLTDRFTNKIEKFYKKHKKLTEAATNELKHLLSEKQRIRMKISKNAIKAKMFRKKLSRNFYIPQQKY